MLKDLSRTSPVSFYALPFIVVGLVLSSYLIVTTLFENQVEAKKKYLTRELDMAAGRVLQQVEEFKSEIPYVSEADDFGQVFNEKTPEAARLRFRLKRIAARYRSFIDTLIVYNQDKMYFIHASRNGVTEEGYRTLSATSLPLQFTPTTKFIHISGSKSLSIIPVTWDSSKVHVGVLLDLFELIKKESDMQFIGDHGIKFIFSEYQGTETSWMGEKIQDNISLPSEPRMHIVEDLLDSRHGSTLFNINNERYLAVYAPMDLFTEKFGMVFMLSDDDYIGPIQMTITGILLLYFFIIIVITTVFVYNMQDIGKKNRQLQEGKTELSRLLSQQTLLLEYGDSFTYTLSPKNKLVYASGNLSALMGYNFEENKDLWDKLIVSTPSNLKELEKRNTAVRTPGTEYAYVLEVKNATGETRILEFREKPFFDASGNLDSIPGTARDITQSHNSRKSILQLLAVLNAQIEASADSILILDANGRLITHNYNFIRQFSIEKPIPPETPITNFRKPIDTAFENSAWLEEILHDATQTTDNTLTTELSMGDRTIEVYTSPVKSQTGEYFGRLWAFSDITPRKQELAELREAKRLADLGAREKENFLSTMSHEIRTPLNAIVGFAELLLSETPREEQKEYLMPLKYSADSLLALINDILDLSKIESGTIVFNPEKCSVRDRLERLTQLFKASARQSGVELHININPSFPAQIMIDVTRFDQIIINLLSNAVKFTHAGSIEISVKLGEICAPDQREILVSVIDTGIGISDENLSKIFKNFYQADSNTTRKYGGTGLGLAITRKLVELQGGYIRAESAIDKGSTFFFMLPAAIAADSSQTLPDIAPEEITLKGVNVLLVEDNPFNQKVAQRFLHINGADVSTADSGIQALQLLEKNKFHIVLLDLQMPGMDGFEVAHYIRNNLALDYYLPIIALTADAQTETRQKAAESKIDDLLLKPFDHKVLNARIAHLLKSNGINP